MAARTVSSSLRQFIREAAVRRVAGPKQEPIPYWTILRGDEVFIRAGSDKGKRGKVLKVDRENNRVVVDGLNLVSCVLPCGVCLCHRSWWVLVGRSGVGAAQTHTST